MNRIASKCIVLGSLFAIACSGEDAGSLGRGYPGAQDPGGNGPGPAPSSTDPGPGPDQCGAGLSYIGFDGVQLEASRAQAPLGVDRGRVKPYSALVTEYPRVLGNTPASLAGAATTFGQPPARWYEEPVAGAVSLQTALAIAFKAAILGVNTIPDASFGGSVGGVSFQPINDMASTIAALGGGPADPRKPDRAMALAAMTSSQAMSAARLGASPTSLSSLKEGYATALDALRQAPPVFDYTAIANAYGQPPAQTAVRSFASKFVAAELMVRAGANVVVLSDGGWDTHDDVDGTTVRNKMTSYVLGPMNTFISRMVADTTRNVTLCIMGDFARSLPGSDHQPNLTATVIGRNVKQGTTGRTIPGTVGLPPGTPSIPGLWAYLAAVAKVPGAPFGANPHNLVL